MVSKNFHGNLMLVICAFLWGSTFVAQDIGAKFVGPYTYIAMRSIIAVIVLMPVILVFDSVKTKKFGFIKLTTEDKKTVFIAGIICGIVLFFASAFQQIGINAGASAGKAGFITAMYILFVPVTGIFFKRKLSLKMWTCVVLGVTALYFLCVKSVHDLIPKSCDVYLIVCAFVFTAQILLVDYFSPRVDGIRLSCIQFAVVGIISFILMLITEKPSVSEIMRAWAPILYAGVLSSGAAYTLQIVAQKYANPEVASLLMSLESSVAVLSGIAVMYIPKISKYGSIPSSREWIGCVIMLVAIILSQLPIEQWLKRKKGVKV